MKLLSYITFPLLIFINGGYAQKPSAEFMLQKQVKGVFDIFSVDEMGAMYAFTSKGQFKKYNANFDSLAVFNDVRRYGKLYSIHTENPMRTALYFRDFKTIVLLDRLLQVINKIDLRKSNIYQVKAVAQSYDNKIWVFDEQDSKIKKINLEGAVDLEYTDLRLVFDEKISPVKMFEAQSHLFLYDPANGFYMFDYYGGFKKKLTYTDLLDVQSNGDMIVGRKSGKLIVINVNTVDAQELPLDAQITSSRQVIFAFNALYTLGADGINKYGFKLHE